MKFTKANVSSLCKKLNIKVAAGKISKADVKRLVKAADDIWWTDELEAMRSALRLINNLFLKKSDVEETAKKEAIDIKGRIDSMNKEQLIDFLTQAVMDFEQNDSVPNENEDDGE